MFFRDGKMELDFSQQGLKMIFEITDDNTVALRHFSCNANEYSEKKLKWCTVSDIHISGKDADDHHGAKHTGCYGNKNLKYKEHNFFDNEFGKKLEFVLSDGKITAVMHYQFYSGIAAVRCWMTVENNSKENIGLEYVTSFCYTGFDNGGKSSDDSIKVYIPYNTWQREYNWRINTPSELGFDRLNDFSFKRIMQSNSGTWSSKEALPMGAVENTEKENTIMWQIESNGAWNWEISDIADMLYLKLSGPSEQENQWYKELKPNEKFEGVKACVAVGSDFNAALAEMTAYRRMIFTNNEANKSMPVFFNDYMNCLWAEPTEEKLIPVIDKAYEAGAEYYVMDAGWYADGNWWDTVGEWIPCGWRFPNGIKKVFDYVRSKGMRPGIWLEIEVMGVNCALAEKFEDECFFMRHGKRVIDHGRYILDFRSKRVREFTMSVIDRMYNDYGIRYIKNDYNVDGGIGTEIDSDSFGDGLLQHNRAFICWIKEINKKYPDLILENCASGGLRADYLSLQNSHLQSVSDQTDYKRMGAIAAASQTAVLPEQTLVWSYPLADATEDAVVFNMANAMLSRILLSGQIMSWSDNQMKLVKEGIECYKKFRSDIPKAIPFYPIGIPQNTSGWLCVAHRFGEKTRLTVWRTASDEAELFIPLQKTNNSAKVLYPSYLADTVTVAENGVCVKLKNKYSAVIFEV